MNVTVRSAQPGDGKIIWMLTRELAAGQQELDLFQATPEDFENALSDPRSLCGCELAIIDEGVAGQAFWHRSFSIYRGKPCLYIENLFIRERYRRKGAARALLTHLAKTAQQDGFATLYWLMMDGNIAGQELYRSIGAEFEAGINFYRLKGEALQRLAAR